MILKRFKCSNPCNIAKFCKEMPLELHIVDKRRDIDILFVSEFPGSTEAKEQRYLTSTQFGQLFRNVLSRLTNKYKFNFGITGITKAIHNVDKAKGNIQELKHCFKHIVKKEIEYCNPKVIIILGDFAYNIIYNKQIPYSSVLEDGRMERMKLFGQSREVMYCMHPIFYTSKKIDSCAIGLLYENIRRAICFSLYSRDWRIPQEFETNILTKTSQVKDVLNELRNTKDFCCIDTEGPNLNRVYSTNNLSIQLCSDGKVGHVIPLDHFESPFRKKLPQIYELLHNFFTGRTKVKGYLYVNAKFDYHKIYRDIKAFSLNAPQMDVSFAEYSLEENLTRIHGFPKQKGAFSLFTMAYKRGYNYYRDTDGKEKRDRLAYLPLKEWTEYAGADVVCPWHIYYSQLLLAKDTGYLDDFIKLNNVFFNHLNRITTYSEHCGLSINLSVVKELIQKSGALNSGIEELLDKFYDLESVRTTNEKLVQSELGVSSTGLFGTTRFWTPSKQLHREVLYFDTLNLEPIDDDEDSSTTGKAFQISYKGIPEVDLLAEYNALTKLQTSFVNPVYKWMNKTSPDYREDFSDSRVRGSFLNDAVTGRLKSIQPNTQQRATHGKYAKKILTMYEPPKSRIVVKLDYSTFEIRGLGFISKDKSMIDSFVEMHKIKNKFRKNPLIYAKEGYNIAKDLLKKQKLELNNKISDFNEYKESLSSRKKKERTEELNREIKKYKEDKKELNLRYKNDPISFSRACLSFLTDFHRRGASLFNNILIEEVTGDQRQQAKNIVFGSIYGRTIASIAKVLGVAEEVAQEYFEKFMTAMPDAVGWLDKMKKLGRKKLYVSSPMGRRRRLWGHFHSNKSIKSKMDRYSMNTIIQGAASDMNLIAGSLLIEFINEHNKLKYQTSDQEAWFCTNLIHDCTEMEIPIIDLLYFVLNIEKLFTEYLTFYLKKVFKFDIQVPIEVDFSIGINYANYKDWNGSKQHLYEIGEWLVEEINKRDNTNISFKELKNNPLFKQYKQHEIAKRVVKKFVKKDKKLLKHYKVYNNEN